MALATHQLQGSYRTCPLSPSSWTTGNKLRHSVTKIPIGQKDNFISLKCKSCLRYNLVSSIDLLFLVRNLCLHLWS
uniref:Putative ovule protein n=1 Tax=Solanum chacoense TaxID=4108 RepID=A0A0V0HCE0_SOLCH